MIPRIRALAVDDEDDHLKAIQEAATKAGFGCVPLLYPRDTSAEELSSMAFNNAQIRMIITDLHLDPAAQTRGKDANFGIIANLINQLNLPAWTPYVLILWTQYQQDADGLGNYLEQRLPSEKLPGFLLSLNKQDYNIPSDSVDHVKLLKDLQEKIGGSRGVNVLLEWEREIIQAADNVVRKLLEVARSGKEKTVSFDEELDRVLSSIAQTATSKGFASQKPRAAANGGLLPVLVDEMEHLTLTQEQNALWHSALARAAAGKKTPPLEKEIALLNDALHISKDGVTSGSDRGAVLLNWHDADSFKVLWGLDISECFSAFSLEKWPEIYSLKYLQIEGLCDSTQQKKGVVPFVLACEVLGNTEVVEKHRPASIEISPTYIGTDGDERKLVVNLRYFFTTEREDAKSRKAEYRVRESLVNKWAFAWANHAIRPGTVEFHSAK
ncbi:hypothetical protein [Janthinobacterium violaceinigrum]|uniref:Response receiver domain-containing protein n=1 Tax=Janthinobacterium violaceinigrum TaxID=2654252 RepID=A0A6I1I9V8_9BURK|nr:hypothetical protein [Janthinobacterium violaceinigrum]KAB8065226.1 hypothetical protein GCN75_09480 [Janthinobacterium violaceinigrum]